MFYVLIYGDRYSIISDRYSYVAKISSMERQDSYTHNYSLHSSTRGIHLNIDFGREI